MEDKPKRTHNPQKQYVDFTLVELKDLRKEVMEAFKIMTGKEFVIRNSKDTYYYRTLSEDILDVTKGILQPQGISISTGTMFKFFKDDINLTYQVKTIEGIKKYIEEIEKVRSTNLPVVRNKEQEETKEKTGPSEISFDDKKFNILILPFYNPEDYTYKSLVGNELKIRLRENNDLNNFGIDVEYFHCDSFDYTTKMAKMIGREIKNTNMVIWGKDSKPKELIHEIYFYYSVPVEKYSHFIHFEGKTEKFQISRLVEITVGEMRLEIENVIFWLLANKFLSEKQYEKSLDNINKIANELNYNDDLCILAATCYHCLNMVKKSEEFFIKGLALNPNNARGNNNYSVFLSSEYEDHERAITYSKKVIELEPKNWRGYYGVALSLIELNDLEGANENFKTVVDLEPDNYQLHYLYGKFLFYDARKFEEAREQFDEALKLKPNDAKVIRAYARLLTSMSSDKEEAKNLFKKALEIEENNEELLVGYAIVLVLDGCNEEAKKQYDLAKRINPELKDKFLEKEFGLK